MNYPKKHDKTSILEPNEEIIGTLHEITDNDTSIKIAFIYTSEIEIPNSKVTYKKLHSLVGKKIGILNFEGKFFFTQNKK